MALSNLYIFNYNNYFNRIVKKEDSLNAYGEPIFVLENANFNISDGVDTQHIMGKSDYNGAGDYLIEVDNEDNILTRWFITDTNFNRQGQWVITLRRDLIVDHYEDVVNAPMIVEKAMVNSINNPLLYNPEGFSFNQIKKQEILLKDKIQVPWYVLYFKKNMGAKTGSFVPSDSAYNKKIGTTIENSIYKSGISKITKNEDIKLTYRVNTNDAGWFYATDQYVMHNRADGISHVYDGTSALTSVIWFNNRYATCETQLNSKFSTQFTALKEAMLTDTGNAAQITNSEYEQLRVADGLVVLTSDNKLYKIAVSESTQSISGKIGAGLTRDICNTLINSTTLDRSDHFGNNTLGYEMTLHTLSVTATEITTGTYQWTIDFTNCPCEDSDFDILAIPYSDTRFTNGNTTFYVKGAVNERFVRSIMNTIPAATEANGYLVDIQLLPYCPDPNVMANYLIDVSSYTNPGDLTDHPRYNFNNAGNIYNNSFMLYIVKSNISFDISRSISVTEITSDKVMDYKISNECDLYKIVSPNYNGSFEFSVAKNDGIDLFNVDMTLKPYQPYIHINPNFKSLYGSDFNDSKGLICGGDFSLPIYSNMWAQYELQNKNYQNIFDRQVKNLDFNQRQERIASGFQAGVGIVQGTVTGAAAGGSVGGGYGAIAGAVVGGVASSIGAGVDISMMHARQAENKSFMIDNYKYQLGNIKALPDTINKVTPLTYNNKIWPFVELYSATDEEKNLLKNYIEYQSMTVNAVGNITSYLQNTKTFIKGQIIRLEELEACTHEANEIYNEIMKGVYI